MHSNPKLFVKTEKAIFPDSNAKKHNKSAFNNHFANDGFDFVSFKSDRPFKLRKFTHFSIDRLPSNVFRAKSTLWFQESPTRNIFQLSRPRYDLQFYD